MTKSEIQTLASAVAEVVIPAVVRELRHQRRTSAKTTGLMSESQAAQCLGVSIKVIRKNRAKLHARRSISGKRWVYSREDLDRYGSTEPWVRISK